MVEQNWSRREILKAAAALGVAALTEGAAVEGQAAQTAAAEKKTPTVGIQMGLPPLATGDLDRVFDELRERGGVNALFPFIYKIRSFVTARVCRQRGFMGGILRFRICSITRRRR